MGKLLGGVFLAGVVALGACSGGNPSVGYACDQVGTALCIRANQCDLLGGQSQEACLVDFQRLCCEDDRRCDKESALSDDEIDTCAQSYLDFGCDLLANGDVPRGCDF